MSAATFEDHLTIGVSSVVEVLEDCYGNGNGPKIGSVGIVVSQRPYGGHRYGVMIPGDPMVYSYRASMLRVLQGVDHRNWWVRTK